MVYLNKILCFPCHIYKEGVDMRGGVLGSKFSILGDDIIKVSIVVGYNYDV